ncbi:MAG: roadblock/LC7 domain-containing protein [Myxococcales bacterium]|nr:roadblock/LC7 domain-containing protein [Myxococcales bacterium]
MDHDFDSTTSPSISMETPRNALHSAILAIRQKAGLVAIMVVTADGNLLAESGDFTGVSLTALSALSAGLYAASQEIARLIGENEFKTLLHEGEGRFLHLSAIDSDTLLIAVLDDPSRLGMVRLTIRKGHPSLKRALARFNRIAVNIEPLEDPEFKDQALRAVDELFSGGR